MPRPVAIDLFTGLHGWAEGLVAEGWAVIGFDIEDMCAQFGVERPEHVYLVMQDVLTLHGRLFKRADLIVASPPCQEFSYMAMPWKRGKQIARALRGEDTFPEGYKGSRSVNELNRLFDACFRIQREACEATGRYIPMVVENVRGAEKWVGKARGNFGSYYLWGDVPALMPPTIKAQKFNPDGTTHGQGSWFAIANSKNRGAKTPGFRFDGSGKSFQSESVKQHVRDNGQKTPAGNCSSTLWKERPIARYAHATPQEIEAHGFKQPGISGKRNNGKGDRWTQDGAARSGSKYSVRKFASAQIAKIPLPLSRHIGAFYHPSRRA